MKAWGLKPNESLLGQERRHPSARASIPESEIVVQKQQDYLAVGAVISELVSARLFPVLRENTGKFLDSSLKEDLIRVFVVQIQWLISRFP